MNRKLIATLMIMTIAGSAMASKIGLQARIAPSLTSPQSNRFCFGAGCLLNDANCTRTINVRNTGTGQLTNLQHSVAAQCLSGSNLTISGSCQDGGNLDAGASCTYTVDACGLTANNPCDGLFTVAATGSGMQVSDTSQLRYCQSVPTPQTWDADTVNKTVTVDVPAGGQKTYKYTDNNSINTYIVFGDVATLAQFEDELENNPFNFITITCNGLDAMTFSITETQ